MTTSHQATPGPPRSFLVPLLVISAALVVPFAVLEVVNRRAFQEAFPFLLFTFMSLHALLIALALTPALRCLQAARSLRALTPGHWAGLLLGAVLLYGFVAVVLDQLPCFLGVPNCD